MSLKKYKIVIASDHAGFDLKESLGVWLTKHGHDVKDLGPHSDESVDYPDFGKKLGDAMTAGEAEFGIAICGSGIGISIAVNRFSAVRSALCRDKDDAFMARLHNDANVLALGARKTDDKTAKDIVRVFLDTEFEGGRHARRVEKLGSCS